MPAPLLLPNRNSIIVLQASRFRVEGSCQGIYHLSCHDKALPRLACKKIGTQKRADIAPKGPSWPCLFFFWRGVLPCVLRIMTGSFPSISTMRPGNPTRSSRSQGTGTGICSFNGAEKTYHMTCSILDLDPFSLSLSLSVSRALYSCRYTCSDRQSDRARDGCGDQCFFHLSATYSC